MAKNKEVSGFEHMMEDIRTGNHGGGLMTVNVNHTPNATLRPILTFSRAGEIRGYLGSKALRRLRLQSPLLRR